MKEYDARELVRLADFGVRVLERIAEALEVANSQRMRESTRELRRLLADVMDGDGVDKVGVMDMIDTQLDELER